jgi:hypothetical protein
VARNANFYNQTDPFRQAPNLRHGARAAKEYLTNELYKKNPNKETFVARPGRGVNGESSN